MVFKINQQYIQEILKQREPKSLLTFFGQHGRIDNSRSLRTKINLYMEFD